MKLGRVVVIVGLTAAAVLVGLVLAFTPAFQTWAVRRVLASHPGWQISVGHVSAGLHAVTLQDVRMERAGYRVTLPTIQAELPMVSALFRRHVDLTRIAAHGITVVPLDKIVAGASSVVATPGVPDPTARSAMVRSTANVPAPREPNIATAAPFHGVFEYLELPFDFSADTVDLSARVVLHSNQGTANLTLTGGGIGAGRVAKLALNAAVTLTDRAVKRVGMRGVVSIAMTSPRSFGRIEANFDAQAAGADLNAPVRLVAAVTMARSDGAENYTIVVHGADRQLLAIQASYPRKGGSFSGSWAVNMRDTDVAPFALGTALPSFTAVGGGSLESDPQFTDVHAVGRIDAAVDRLVVLKRDFAAVGPIKVTADIDLAQHGDLLAVAKLDASITTNRRVAEVKAAQAFDFNPRTGELHAHEVSRELLDVSLDGVPLGWLKPFIGDFEVQGSGLSGELVATPRANGISVRSKTPLVVTGLNLRRSGRSWVRNVDFSLSASADYTPEAWQAELSGVTARQAGRIVLLLDAKAGQLAGANQPVKATGLVTVDLPVLLTQFLNNGDPPLTAGDGTIEFTTSLGTEKQLQARLSLKNLAAVAAVTKTPLPSITADVRADFAGTKITVRAPITMQRAGRTSDLTVAGILTPAAGGGSIDAQVMSENLVLDDANAFTPVLRALRGSIAQGAAGPASMALPAWGGWNGAVAVQLKRVLYSDLLQLSNVVGTLRLSGPELKFEDIRAGIGETGEARAVGAVQYHSDVTPAYSVAADVAMTDINVTPFFRAFNAQQPPTAEGKFTITTKLTGHGPTLGAISLATASELTSKGGTFRGIPASVGNLVENSGKLASWFASAGNAITALAGRKEYDEIPTRSQAANELARILASIPYDQLSVSIVTDEKGDADFRALSLISPEIRLSGHGRGTPTPGGSIFDDSVTFEYTVGARGRPAELMKYLGVLAPKADDLGYLAGTIPVRVDGTIAKLDATEVSNRLVALAVEKTGLTEKAVDWINRLRGKTNN